MEINLSKTAVIVFRNGGHLKRIKNGSSERKGSKRPFVTNIWDFISHPRCHGPLHKKK